MSMGVSLVPSSGLSSWSAILHPWGGWVRLKVRTETGAPCFDVAGFVVGREAEEEVGWAVIGRWDSGEGVSE